MFPRNTGTRPLMRAHVRRILFERCFRRNAAPDESLVGRILFEMSSDQVTVALGGELDPGLIRPFTGDDYLGVVMPMRI